MRARNAGASAAVAVTLATMASCSVSFRMRGTVADLARPAAAQGASTAILTPTVRVSWAWLQAPGGMRLQVCGGLEPGAAETAPPPLADCVDVVPWSGAPTSAADGQMYIVWAGGLYRALAAPTPAPGWCEPVVIVVTATPTNTPTPDWIATAVVGTLTALAPSALPPSRATETMESTPTPLERQSPKATRTPWNYVKVYAPWGGNKTMRRR